MNCEPVQRVLDAFLDGELDPATQVQVRLHLVGCAACTALHGSREALRSGLRQLPRHQAPSPLRLALAGALDAEASAAAAGHTSGRARRWRPALWLAAGVAAGYALALWLAVALPPRDLREPVLARHVASFDEGRPRVDIPSSDRHAVKPWFAGRLDFAPTVRDLSAQGYDLHGGRLEAVGSQPAAVLVYRVRRHHISLFVARSPEAERPPSASSLRGFAVVSWVHDGLVHTAVSDVDPHDLRRFADLMAPQPR